MSTFEVVLRDGRVDRLVSIDAGSKREVESKVARFFARDGQVEILSITKTPHSKTVKHLPKHIESYLDGGL